MPKRAHHQRRRNPTEWKLNLSSSKGYNGEDRLEQWEKEKGIERESK